MKRNKTYKYVILPLTVAVLSSCSNYPPEQKEFLNKINEFRASYEGFEGNNIAQDNECEKLGNYVQGVSFNNWIGKVNEVNSMLGSRWVVVNIDNVSLKIWPENDSKWNELGENILGNLKRGSKIKFSGKVIREMSLTCFGKMDEPEIKIEPSSIELK